MSSTKWCWYSPYSWFCRSDNPESPDDPNFKPALQLFFLEFIIPLTADSRIFGIRLLATNHHAVRTCSTLIHLDHPARNVITAYPGLKKDQTVALFIAPQTTACLYAMITRPGLVYWDPVTRQQLTDSEADTRVITALQEWDKINKN